MAVTILQMIGEELFISVGGQAIVFIKALSVGVMIAAVYECFRFLRCLIKHNDVMVAVEDVVFCIAAAVFSFHFWLYAAKGELRAFVIVGEWCGAAVYFLTLGRLVSIAERVFSRTIKYADEPVVRLAKSHIYRKNKPVKPKNFNASGDAGTVTLVRLFSRWERIGIFTQKKRK